ncbi:MAG: hypothetical protein ACTSWP_03685 [Candidatus Freyarchaeota archaeon]
MVFEGGEGSRRNRKAEGTREVEGVEGVEEGARREGFSGHVGWLNREGWLLGFPAVKPCGRPLDTLWVGGWRVYVPPSGRGRGSGSGRWPPGLTGASRTGFRVW